MPYGYLVEIFAEWQMKERPDVDDETDDAWLVKWREVYTKVRDQHIPPVLLVDKIWRRAREQALCEDGGWEAWMCPYGCAPHRVPFSADVRP
jgi:hypothetical protein